MGKRDKIGKHYVERDSKGRFKKWVSIGKSLKADRRQKAKKKVKSGYGHQGDQKTKKVSGVSSGKTGGSNYLAKKKKEFYDLKPSF